MIIYKLLTEYISCKSLERNKEKYLAAPCYKASLLDGEDGNMGGTDVSLRAYPTHY